jgi:hypothetical protein
MRKYIFLIVALAFVACEKTIFVGGTVTDYLTGDSIEGIEMGLFVAKPDFSYSDKKWSGLELIATDISNSKGFFSMEIDADMNMSHSVFYYPLPPTDTLSVNAQYTPDYSLEVSFNSQYGTNGRFRLYRSSNIQVNLIHFAQKELVVKYGNSSVAVSNRTYSTYLQYVRPLTGRNYKFDLYEVVDYNRETLESQLKYLGSTSRYLKTQLPEDIDQVEWFMPIQEIEIDYNTLEK